MATEITAEQRAALKAADRVEVVDPETQEHYVLIRANFYERLMATVDFGDQTEQEKKAALQRWGKSSGWEDPADSVFDELKPQ
jgi:hypothetical protein